MLIGSYQNSIDAKNRVIIPAKFREELGERCYLTRGLDNCLVIYPEKVFAEMADRLASLPRTSVEARKLNRFLFMEAEELMPDSQGRVVLSADFRAKVGIRKDLVTIGVRDHVEIWAKEVFDSSEEGGLITAEDFARFSEKYNV